MVQTARFSGACDSGWAGPALGMNENILNLPNFLTLCRIVLTPLIVYAILLHQTWLALGMMFVAGVSDMLDGWVAKRFGQQTIVGAYMDPIADKLLLIGSIVALYLIGQVPLFLFLAVVFRDVIIVGGAIMYELVTRRLKMEPTLLSKATTVLQIVYVLVVILNMVYLLPAWLVHLSVWCTFTLTCMSGIHYMIAWTLKAMREEV